MAYQNYNTNEDNFKHQALLRLCQIFVGKSKIDFESVENFLIQIPLNHIIIVLVATY